MPKSSDFSVRTYQSFFWKGAAYRICCADPGIAEAEIVHQRAVLEAYLLEHAAFADSLVPLEPLTGAPEIARRMARAATRVGVGPMAAVAGTMAQFAAEAALQAGSPEAIVENGGDLFLVGSSTVTVGLYAGAGRLAATLAFRVEPEQMPLALCSSSGNMGHSFSFGHCDLATVVAQDAALADAAATFAANRVAKPDDLESALEQTMAISGIQGVLLVKDEKMGMAGNLPPLIRADKAEIQPKITRSPGVFVP